MIFKFEKHRDRFGWRPDIAHSTTTSFILGGTQKRSDLHEVTDLVCGQAADWNPESLILIEGFFLHHRVVWHFQVSQRSSLVRFSPLSNLCQFAVSLSCSCQLFFLSPVLVHMQETAVWFPCQSLSGLCGCGMFSCMCRRERGWAFCQYAMRPGPRLHVCVTYALVTFMATRLLFQVDRVGSFVTSLAHLM